MSTTVFEQTLRHPIDQVWGIHASPGIVTRLTPGFSRVEILQGADNLKSGLTRMQFPGRIIWNGKHDPAYYQPLGNADQHVRQPAQFSDTCSTPGLGSAIGWRHVHSFYSLGGGANDAGDAGSSKTSGAAEAGSTRSTSDSDSDSGKTLLRDTITTNGPGFLADKMLRGIFGYRQAQLAGDLTHLQQSKQWQGPTTETMTIAVTGATGLIGNQLCALLELAGHRVIRLSRNAQQHADIHGAKPGGMPQEFRQWDPENPDPNLLRGVDAVAHLAGHSIVGRFTKSHLNKIKKSRVGPTLALANLAAETESVHTFISASAVGFYGAEQHPPADETAGPDLNSELGRIVKQWEDATAPAREAGLRVAQIRTGLVLAGGSTLLDLLTASVRAGGGALGSGRQHFAWIGINDLVDIYHRALTDPLIYGPINAVSPKIVSNAEFAETLAEISGNPLVPHGLRSKLLLPIPKAAPRILLGKAGAHELALADQNVVPAQLQHLAHQFRTPDLADTLRHELGKCPALPLTS